MTEPEYRKRRDGEPLAQYLYAMADLIGADRRQHAILERAAAMSYPQRTATDRGEAGRLASMIRDELKAGIDAVIYAAQARGEKVEDFNDEGAVRIRARDGVVSLQLSGGLSEQLVNTAYAYRALYETVGYADVGSQLGRIDGQPVGRSGSTKGLHRRRLDAVLAGERLARADAAVSAEALPILRKVAGEGQSLTSRGMSGHERKRRLAVLVEALQRVRLALAETGGLRITGT